MLFSASRLFRKIFGCLLIIAGGLATCAADEDPIPQVDLQKFTRDPELINRVYANLNKLSPSKPTFQLKLDVAQYLFNVSLLHESYSLLEELRYNIEYPVLSIEAVILASKVRLEQNNFSESLQLAEEAFKQANKLSKLEPIIKARTNLANMLMASGHYGTAIIILQPIVRSSEYLDIDASLTALTTLHQAYLDRGLSQEALQLNRQINVLLNRLKLSNKDSIDMLIFKALTLKEQGFLEEAKTKFEEALEASQAISFSKLSASIYAQLSELLLALKQYPEALKAAEAGIQASQENQSLWYEMLNKLQKAKALLWTAENANARQLLSSVIDYYSRSPRHHLILDSYQVMLDALKDAGLYEEMYSVFNKLIRWEHDRNRYNDISFILRYYPQFIRNDSANDIHELAQSSAKFNIIPLIVAGIALLGLSAWGMNRHFKYNSLKNELSRSNNQLKELTLKDPLTKLHNRRYFLSQIHNEISFVLRKNEIDPEGANKLGLLIIDIDFFKKINDSHGHHIGDEILAGFAKRLLEISRDSDLIIRWGGEEFVAVTRDVNIQSLAKYTKRLMARITSEPFTTSAQPLKVTCSIGGCLLPLFSKNPKLYDWNKTMDLADQALYQAKDNGRNQALIISSAPGKDSHDTNTDKLSTLIREEKVSVNCIFV